MNSSAENPIFRAFAPADLAELEAMALALYAEDHYGEDMSPEKIRCTVEELTRHPDKGRIVIFAAGEAIAGYAIVIHFWSNEHGGDIAALDEIYVKPQWRGRGIASAFLEHLATPGSPPLQAIELEVTPTNHRALAYYRRHGFEADVNRHLFRKL